MGRRGIESANGRSPASLAIRLHAEAASAAAQVRGSCTPNHKNQPGHLAPINQSLPFPQDAVAAAADANPDYAGSCGRCYEVRCRSGYVLGEQRHGCNRLAARRVGDPFSSEPLPSGGWPAACLLVGQNAGLPGLDACGT